MMASIVMSEYRVTQLSGTEKIVVRQDSVGVAEDFEDTENPIVQIQRTRTNIDVRVPDVPAPVFFAISVTPAAAADAACVATPTSFTVLDRTPVVLQAIPTAGFVFDGWFLDAPILAEDADTFDPTEAVSTDATTVLLITAPAPGQERRIEARFRPSP